ALSCTDDLSAGVVTVIVPVRLPWPIEYPETLYSASWSISELVKIKSKNSLICGISPFCGACGHAVPQKISNTSADAISGPLRYVNCGPAAVTRPIGAFTASGTCSGTILTESPCAGYCFFEADLAAMDPS